MSGATRAPIEYAEATPEVRAVYDDIMATRKVDRVNNYWKVLAHHPPTLKRMWANSREVMGPGALDPLTKELIYIAVSVTKRLQLLHRLARRRRAQQGHDARAILRAGGDHRSRQRDQSARRGAGSDD